MDIAGTAIYAYLMELRLTPEQEAELQSMAHHEGKTPEDLLFESFHHLLDRGLREVLEERIRQADRGVLIEEEEMDARIEKMLRD